MRIIGCDLRARQQTIAMLDSDTGSDPFSSAFCNYQSDVIVLLMRTKLPNLINDCLKQGLRSHFTVSA